MSASALVPFFARTGKLAVMYNIRDKPSTDALKNHPAFGEPVVHGETIEGGTSSRV